MCEYDNLRRGWGYRDVRNGVPLARFVSKFKTEKQG